MHSSIWTEGQFTEEVILPFHTCVSLEILVKKFMCLFQIRVMLYFPGIMISNIRWRAFFFTLYCTPGFSPEIVKVSSRSINVKFWKKIYLDVITYQVSVFSLLCVTLLKIRCCATRDCLDIPIYFWKVMAVKWSPQWLEKGKRCPHFLKG